MNSIQAKLLLFCILETVFAAGGIEYLINAHNVVAHQQYTSHNHPESFIDLLYGGLVNGEREISHAVGLLNEGKLEPPIVDYSQINSGEEVGESGDEFEVFKAKKHQAVKNTFGATKLKLPKADYTEDLWTTRAAFGGLNTFANTEAYYCLNEANLQNKDYKFDVAIVGAGFDTGTSYRPGARFGPRSIRLASKRLGGGSLPTRGYLNRKINDHYEFNDEHDEYGRDPFMGTIEAYDSLKIADCGDVPMIAIDNRIALDQLYRGERLIHKYPVPEPQAGNKYLNAPRIITLGGDHTITLLTVKSAFETYGEPITVLHFDSHLDTWRQKSWGGAVTKYSELTHGSFLHFAAEKGYLNVNNSMHIGIRGRLKLNYDDMENDVSCGFKTIFAREVDNSGVKGIVDQIKERVYGTTDFLRSTRKNTPVYITFDIDVLDPVFAPATGTQEPGGFTVREILNILDGLEGINLVGADLVEVAPIYDNPGETTCLNSAHIVDSFLGLMAAFKIRNEKKN